MVFGTRRAFPHFVQSLLQRFQDRTLYEDFVYQLLLRPGSPFHGIGGLAGKDIHRLAQPMICLSTATAKFQDRSIAQHSSELFPIEEPGIY